MLLKLEISTGLTGHLARLQTYLYLQCNYFSSWVAYLFFNIVSDKMGLHQDSSTLVNLVHDFPHLPVEKY